jgi:electron transfer flavoprotein beta subunit
MNIITCVRQTPDTETVIKISGSGTAIETENVKFVLGPYDEYALEAAAQIKEKQGGDVTVVTVGGDRAAETLRHCLAVGGDKAVHLVDNGVTQDDPTAVASALANQIKKMPHDLVFVSNKGSDSDRGAVSPMLAEFLGLPYVGLVTEIEVEDGGKSIIVARDVEGGAKERFRVQLPAVISAQKGVRGEPRYAALPAIMKAKKKPVETVPAEISVTVQTQVEKLEYPPARPPGRMVSGGSAVETAKELIRLLREEAKVL